MLQWQVLIITSPFSSCAPATGARKLKAAEVEAPVQIRVKLSLAQSPNAMPPLKLQEHPDDRFTESILLRT